MELEAAEKRSQKATKAKGDAVTPVTNVDDHDDDEKRLEELRSRFEEVTIWIPKMFFCLSCYMITIIHQLSIYASMTHSLLNLKTF